MYKVIPAYGRYNTSTYESIAKDWKNGKDFQFLNGPYFSIRDFDKIKEENYHHRIDDILFGSKEDAPVLCIFFKDTGLDIIRRVEVYPDGELAFTI